MSASTRRPRRFWLGAWSLLPLALTLARPAGAVATCQRSCTAVMCEGDDCAGECDDNEVCEANLCRPKCGNGTCLATQICVNGSCEAPQCETNDHCDGGVCRQCRCEPMPTCSAETGCTCTSNDDCDAGLACSVTGTCQAPVRAGSALEFSCALAGGEGAAPADPLAALLLAAMAAGARRRRATTRASEDVADRDLRHQDP